MRVCSVHGCPELYPAGEGSRCRKHRRAADQARGSARARGYDKQHEARFRRAVLARDPVCVRCRQRRSQHADHHPLDRHQLIAAGHDPHDPKHGRGLCQPCHSTVTAEHQPGGFRRA